MPLPKPKQGEKKNEFISRCISFVKGEDPNTTNAQASGMCYTAWSNRNKDEGDTMSIQVNSKGKSFANSLISGDKINFTGSWSFSAADGNKLLGPDGDDWANYGKHHLAEDTGAEAETKARYKYPFAKNGTIYRRGVIAAKSRAAQQGQTNVADAADDLLTKINEKMDKWNKKKKGDAMYEHIAVIRPRNDFLGGTFEFDWDADLPKGIWVVKGAIDGGSVNTDDMQVQRYEFAAHQWTPDQAKKWLDRQGIEFSKFISAEKDPKVDSLKDVTRADFINVNEGDDNFMAEKFEMTEDGFLKGRAVVTNVGVFPYRNRDGSITRELRPPEEVFDFDSIKSLEMVPLTDGHPSMKVDSENIRELRVGGTGDSIRTDQYRISAPLVIQDPDVVTSIRQNGKKAVSCGYTVDLEDRSGTWMGVDYDKIQRNIRYNHIAVNIDRGRAGDDAALKLDSVDAFSIDMDNNQSREDNMSLKKVTLDGVEYEAEAKVIETLHSAQDELKAKTDELETLKTDKSTIEAERDSLKDENDQLKKDKEALENAAPEKLDEAVEARMTLLDNAKTAEVEVKDEMKEDEIKKAIILKAFPKASDKLDEADEAYINARYDAAVEYLEERKDVSDKNKEKVSEIIPAEKKSDSEIEADAEKARNDYIKRMKDAYKREDK